MRWRLAAIAIVTPLLAGWGQDALSRATLAKKDSDASPATLAVNPGPKSNIPVRNLSGATNLPTRTVYIELHKVENALKYNLQIRPYYKTWQKPYFVSMADTRTRVRLIPGRYSIRTRSLDGLNTPGPWGQWSDFWVHLRSPSRLSPVSGTVIEPSRSPTQAVRFEWSRVDLAKIYVFQLYDSTGYLIGHIKTPKTRVTMNIQAESSFAWTVRPVRSDFEPVDIRPSQLNPFRVGKLPPYFRTVAFRVAPVAHATSYEFELNKFDPKKKVWDWKVIALESARPQHRVRLEPGYYKMRSRSVSDFETKSAWSTAEGFRVFARWTRALKTIAPLQGKRFEPTSDLATKISLKWQPLKGADRYKVFVYDGNDQLVASKFSKDHSTQIKLPHNKKYRWQVIPLQKNEPDRSPASITSKAESEFRIKKYERLHLTVAEEPSQFYGWARYITSNINYQAKNYDNNTLVRQPVYGGTGELAFGYWYRKTDFGLMAAAALAGFTIGGQTYVYKAASLLAGVRKKSDDTQRLRVWVGLGYKEIPEIMVGASKVYFSQVANIGPELRVSYLNTFGKKTGYQIYGSANYGLLSIKTPNNMEEKAALSYSAGAFWTYRFQGGDIGMVGYTYQVDSAAYKSIDVNHSTNYYKLAGHYLSLTYQFALERAVR